MIERIKFWWHIASNVWITLAIGWAVVIISYVFKWEFPASGAVLTCSVIVSELLFNQREFYDALERSTEQGSPLYLPRFFRRIIREMCKGNEEPSQVAKRIHNRVHQVMAISVISGTIIWGYGHRWVENIT